jgi:hypothetical protein
LEKEDWTQAARRPFINIGFGSPPELPTCDVHPIVSGYLPPLQKAHGKRLHSYLTINLNL